MRRLKRRFLRQGSGKTDGRRQARRRRSCRASPDRTSKPMMGRLPRWPSAISLQRATPIRRNLDAEKVAIRHAGGDSAVVSPRRNRSRGSSAPCNQSPVQIERRGAVVDADLRQHVVEIASRGPDMRTLAQHEAARCCGWRSGAPGLSRPMISFITGDGFCQALRQRTDQPGSASLGRR